MNNSSAIILSIHIAILASLINLPLAIGFGWLLVRRRFWGRGFLDGILNLPLVLPPVITGYLLLRTLGRQGAIGQILEQNFGIRLAFSFWGAVIASTIVSFPLVLRAVRVAISMSDPKLEQAAETLGAGSCRRFFTILLPQITPGIINGIILGFARSLGEFGATITFAGNIEGKTRTIPTAIYSLIQVPGKEDAAMHLVIISAVISILAITISERLHNRPLIEQQTKTEAVTC